MRSSIYISRMWASITIVVLLFCLTVPANAQKRTRTGIPTNFDDVVFAISFSPDGRTLAIARGAREPLHRFGRIELWDTASGKLLHLIKGFDGPVRSISFSPDSQTLISSSIEFRTPKIQQNARSREGVTFGELKWWDARTGELKRKLSLPGEGAFSIRATQSTDGKQLALAETFWDQTHLIFDPLQTLLEPRGFPRVGTTTFYRSQMKLIDAGTGDLRFKLDVSRPGATSFSPDGNLLAVANGSEVKLWDTRTGKEARKLKDLRGDVSAIAFSPDGRSLAVASTKYEREDAERFIKIIGISEVKLFDVENGKVTLRLKDIGAVNSLAFTPDGRILVIGGVLPQNKGEAAGMKLFDFQTGKVTELRTGADYKEAVDSLTLSRDGGLLAFSAGPATVKLFDTVEAVMRQTWDADSVGDAVERPTSRFLLSVTRVLAVAFSADGTTVSGETDHGEIKSWDYRTGEVKRHLSVEQNDLSVVAASINGKSFAEVNQGELFYWNAASDTKRPVPLPGREPITALALTGDGLMLALATGGDLTLISPTGDVLKKLSGQKSSVNRLAFSIDGRKLAVAGTDGNIAIWNVETGRIEKTVTTQTELTALVFGWHEKTVATASRDNTISIWNLQTGLAQAKFQKHEATVNALAFSPDGQLLASGSDDRTIVLWEVAAGKSKRTFKGHDQTVTSLAFSPDGLLLASGSGNASVVVWEVGTGKLSRVLK